MTTALRREGLALFLVVGFLAVIMLGSAAFYVLLNRTLDHDHAQEKRLMTFAIAEAGVSKALASLTVQDGAYTGEADAPLGEGSFTVEVTPAGKTGAYQIVSTATLGPNRHAQGRPHRKGTSIVRIEATAAPAQDGHLHVVRWEECGSW